MGITCHSELVATCLTTMHEYAASNFIMCRCEFITSMPRAVRLSWLENAYSCSSFWRVILTRKVGQTDLVSDQGSIVGLCTKDYNVLCAQVTICDTQINIQTHRQTAL